MAVPSLKPDKKGEIFVAIDDHEGAEKQELSFKKGDKFKVIKSSPEERYVQGGGSPKMSTTPLLVGWCRTPQRAPVYGLVFLLACRRSYHEFSYSVFRRLVGGK